jgi:hypothetical protein
VIRDLRVLLAMAGPRRLAAVVAAAAFVGAAVALVIDRSA